MLVSVVFDELLLVIVLVLPVMPYVLYVVVVLEVVQQLAHLCHVFLALQSDGVLRNHLDLSLCELEASFGQCVTNSGKIFRSGVNLEAVLVSLEIICGLWRP